MPAVSRRERIILVRVLVPAATMRPHLTIETASDFSSKPVHGTFEVTEDADILGCSNGTYVDTPPADEVNKVMSCSEPSQVLSPSLSFRLDMTPDPES